MRTLAILALLSALGTASAQQVVRYDPTAKNPPLLHVGDTFVVALRALPGAGYTWQVFKGGREGLSYVGMSTAPVTKGIGGSQTETFVFKATAPGRPAITMLYGRQWEIEKGGSPTQRILIPLIVK